VEVHGGRLDQRIRQVKNQPLKEESVTDEELRIGAEGKKEEFIST